MTMSKLHHTKTPDFTRKSGVSEKTNRSYLLTQVTVIRTRTRRRV